MAKRKCSEMGRRLKLRVETLGWTYSETDAYAGLSRGHTASIISGRRHDVSVSTALALALAIDVRLAWLCAEGSES